MSIPSLSVTVFSSPGLSDVVVEQYGATHVTNLPRDTHSIEHSGLETRVLWKYDDPSYSSQDTRLHVTRSSFVIRHVTQSDSGLYVMRNKYNYELKRWSLKVEGEALSPRLSWSDLFVFSSMLRPGSSMLYWVRWRYVSLCTYLCYCENHACIWILTTTRA